MNTGSLATHMIGQKRAHTSNRLQTSLKRKSVRQRLLRYGLAAANVLVLGGVVVFVVTGTHSSSMSAAGALSDSTAANPVDGQTAYDIAANVARMTNLPESTAIVNQAQSAQVAVAVSASGDAGVVAKPQIVATALKSKEDIQTYTAAAGDTVTSLAQKFGITTDSIKWSNSLNGDTLPLGTKVIIPPVNGVVYTVKAGDTVDSLATKFSANAAQIVASNDAEIGGIQPGEQILIPGGQVQNATVAATTGSGVRGLVGGSYTPLYGNNGYDFGYCTWYVASRIPVPSNWGNANTWAYYAALSGWTVSSNPTAGAIAQTSAGYAGHVAIVTSVDPDAGTVTISEMNATAGWGKVDTRTLPISAFPHYITH